MLSPALVQPLAILAFQEETHIFSVLLVWESSMLRCTLWTASAASTAATCQLGSWSSFSGEISEWDLALDASSGSHKLPEAVGCFPNAHTFCASPGEVSHVVQSGQHNSHGLHKQAGRLRAVHVPGTLNSGAKVLHWERLLFMSHEHTGGKLAHASQDGWSVR